MPIFPKLKKGANGTFGPTIKNHYYYPVSYHNKNATPNPHKSTWCIKENQQYDVFRVADEGSWECSVAKGLFSILGDGTFTVGSGGEVLSFFPNTVNPSDYWHGFPVKSESKRPSSALLDKWVNDKIIGHSARIRIERGQL